MLTDRILRSALIALSTWVAGVQLAAAGIIPNPNYLTPTPIPVSTPTPLAATPTVPPTPNLNALTKADPQLARAVVRYGQNGLLALANDHGRFQKVALLPNQVVTVTLTFSVADYGKPADVQVLDGGAMSTSVVAPKPKDILPTISPPPSPTANAVPLAATTPSPSPLSVSTIPPPPSIEPSSLIDGGQIVTVSQAGELVFAFRPGADVGMHRVSVLVGGNQYFFRFWRQDTAAFNNNAGMLKAY